MCCAIHLTSTQNLILGLWDYKPSTCCGVFNQGSCTFVGWGESYSCRPLKTNVNPVPQVAGILNKQLEHRDNRTTRTFEKVSAFF